MRKIVLIGSGESGKSTCYKEILIYSKQAAK
ncbi:guanine nucleotide-binding protein subunit alpha [Gottfriedia luciferensis]|nr:guanine nucleotide-binding protein subunit alpha [Gottfriedia luciferensis]